MRMLLACLSAYIVCLTPMAALGQISVPEARRMGLELAWQTQVQLPRVGAGVVSTNLWVERSDPKRFAVVELSGRTIRVSADSLDRRGNPIGMDEAKRLAREQAARFLGKNDGFEVVEVSSPRIKLVLVTNDGLVQTLDAETGQLLWATPCGPSSAPAHPAATTSAGVILIHGSSLFLLDWETGKHIMSIPLRYASANAVVACGRIAYVSDFTGRVFTYELPVPLAEGEEKKPELDPWSYRIEGRAVGRPLSLADESFCAIASNAGYVYTFTGGDEPSVNTRYETASAINGSLSTGNGHFYAGTAAGRITKISVDDRLGRLMWEFPTGETVTASPLVLGKQVIVVTESGVAHSIDDETGYAQWQTNGLGLDTPVARAAGQIFFTTTAGGMLALDATSGRVTARTTALNLAKPIINQVDDRLYVLSQSGRLQCLRPQGSVLPQIIQPVAPTEEEPPAEDLETQPEAAPSSDPFAFGDSQPAVPSASSPFGGLLDSPEPEPDAGEGMGNPFGGGGNPFGGDENPFGGADNPFGGDNPFGTP